MLRLLFVSLRALFRSSCASTFVLASFSFFIYLCFPFRFPFFLLRIVRFAGFCFCVFARVLVEDGISWPSNFVVFCVCLCLVFSWGHRYSFPLPCRRKLLKHAWYNRGILTTAPIYTTTYALLFFLYRGHPLHTHCCSFTAEGVQKQNALNPNTTPLPL